MVNNINLMGRMTRDPELRSTNAGTSVVDFTLAVDRDYTTRDGGERQTDFIECVAWKGTAEFIAKHFPKGSLMSVVGRLQVRSWTDRDGNRRRKHEVEVEKAYFAGRNKSSNESISESRFEEADNTGELPFRGEDLGCQA